MGILSNFFGKKNIQRTSLDEFIELANSKEAASAVHSAMTVRAVGIGQRVCLDQLETLLIRASRESGKTPNEIINMTTLRGWISNTHTDNDSYGEFDEEDVSDFPAKAVAFANASISIQSFFEHVGIPIFLQGVLEQHSQEMCSPLYNELELTDTEWEALDREVLALMVLDRNLKEYYTKATPELFGFYLQVACCVAGSIADGHLEVNKNSITHKFCQNAMDSISSIYDSHTAH